MAILKITSEAYSILSNPKKDLYDMKLLLKDNLGEEFILNFS